MTNPREPAQATRSDNSCYVGRWPGNQVVATYGAVPVTPTRNGIAGLLLDRLAGARSMLLISTSGVGFCQVRRKSCRPSGRPMKAGKFWARLQRAEDSFRPVHATAAPDAFASP